MKFVPKIIKILLEIFIFFQCQLSSVTFKTSVPWKNLRSFYETLPLIIEEITFL